MGKKRVLFYCSSPENVKVQKFYQIDFDIIRKNGNQLVLTSNRWDLFKWWKYDALFVYFYTWGAFTSFIARLGFRKVYFTGGIDALNRETTTYRRFLTQKIFFFICYFLSTKCIIVSDNDWHNIKKEYYGLLKKKLVKSYHVIDIEKFYDSSRERNTNFITICWQGAEINVQRKGVDSSLFLFSYLKNKQEFAKSRYTIIGKKGAGTSYIERLIKDLHLEDCVNLLGEVSEEQKINLMKSSQYYFQLSKYEGFGLAALEALAAGNIVIHTNTGGLKYVIGNNGIIVSENMTDGSLEAFYKNLLAFDYNEVIKGQDRIKHDFAYNKRLDDFSKIMSD